MQSHLLPYCKDSLVVFPVSEFYFSGPINLYLIRIVIILFTKCAFFNSRVQEHPLSFVQNEVFIVIIRLARWVFAFGLNFTCIFSWWRIVTCTWRTPRVNFRIFSKKHIFAQDLSRLVIIDDVSYHFTPLFAVVNVAFVVRMDSWQGYFWNFKLLFECERFVFHYE